MDILPRVGSADLSARVSGVIFTSKDPTACRVKRFSFWASTLEGDDCARHTEPATKPRIRSAAPRKRWVVISMGGASCSDPTPCTTYRAWDWDDRARSREILCDG